MQDWRLLESSTHDLQAEMLRDGLLLEEFLADPAALPVLRIYQVPGAAVTVGRYYEGKALPKFRLGGIWGLGTKEIPVCVRPTGGGRVLHGEDLIYSVVARENSFPTFGMVRTSYLSFHEAVQSAYESLGIRTELFRSDEFKNSWPGVWGNPRTECFVHAVPTDLRIGKRKVAGGAQLRRRNGFLHQGSVHLEEGIAFEDLKQALVQTFQNKFGIEWKHESDREKNIEPVSQVLSS